LDIYLARSGHESGAVDLGNNDPRNQLVPGIIFGISADRRLDTEPQRGISEANRPQGGSWAGEGKRRKRCQWQKKRAAFEAAAVIAVFGENRNHLCRNGER